ncbi:hypothetical protein [Streptomyces goshikiensis]|uniref:hypothetical protein n=1 Tax=Streptomyces goshikiensis TaxID=1942 RepID=UPI0036C76DDA
MTENAAPPPDWARSVNALETASGIGGHAKAMFYPFFRSGFLTLDDAAAHSRTDH